MLSNFANKLVPKLLNNKVEKDAFQGHIDYTTSKRGRLGLLHFYGAFTTSTLMFFANMYNGFDLVYRASPHNVSMLRSKYTKSRVTAYADNIGFVTVTSFFKSLFYGSCWFLSVPYTIHTTLYENPKSHFCPGYQVHQLEYDYPEYYETRRKLLDAEPYLLDYQLKYNIKKNCKATK